MEKYMRMAIELALKGEGYVSPNPLVGCVVVKDGRVVATGYHERYGGYHAERNALLSCDEDVTGADLYVTLEPCCHTGKTPPCTDIIIERGIKRVIIGSSDPNPLVSGGGVKALKDAGIEVVTDVLKSECDDINRIFFRYITKKLPYIAVKYAMTLDGKIASNGGRSEIVTGDQAHQHVQLLRKRYSAILAGVGTVIADDPMLTYRGDQAEDLNPIRIIMDSALRIPSEARIVKTAREIKTIVAYTEASAERVKELEKAGVILWKLPADKEGHVSIPDLVKRCGEEGIDSILVEGGSKVHGAFFDHPEYIQQVYAYISPKLIGGADALTPIAGKGVPMSAALKLKDIDIIPLGEDICLTGYPAPVN